MEKQKLILSRLDHYFAGVNTKVGFYLATSTLLIGGVVNTCKPPSGIQLETNQIGFICFFFVLAGATVLSCLFAINPFINAGNGNTYKSLVGFPSICSFKEVEYIDEFQSVTDKAFERDLTIQIHILSQCLTYKFKCLKWASLFLTFELTMGLILIFLFSI